MTEDRGVLCATFRLCKVSRQELFTRAGLRVGILYISFVNELDFISKLYILVQTVMSSE